MREQRLIGYLVAAIACLALVCVLVGLFSDGAVTKETVLSVHGETVSLYGRGIYAYDSVSMAVQGKAQDLVTGLVGLPLLMFSLVWYKRCSFRGRMLLCGTVGYFLYTYVSCTFLWQFNVLFPAYLALMSLSLTCFILLVANTDARTIRNHFGDRAPVRLCGWFEILFGLMLLLLWTARLASAYLSPVRAGLEHYTTFVIQAMDLGIVVPAAVAGGILLLRGHGLGYLMSTVIVMKGFTMGLALIAMMIGLQAQGLGSPVEFLVFAGLIGFLLFLGVRWIGSMREA